MQRDTRMAILLAVALVLPVTPAAAAQDFGSISGTITDAETGAPIVGEYVNANARDSYGGAISASDGSYLIDGLPPGDYRLSAASEAVVSDYVPEYWPDAPSYEEAGVVEVAAGQDVTGIDFVLEKGGVVTGTVTNAWTGSAISEVFVSISQLVRGEWMGSMGTRVAADGAFRIGGLSGEYRLEFYENDYLPVETDSFVIEPGQELTIDIDATPAYGTPYASIAGWVCERAGTAVECPGNIPEESPGNLIGGVTVEARSPSGALLGSSTTDRWGWFNLDGLAPGDIVVSALPPSGFTLIEPHTYTLGPNEGAWDVQLIVDRIDVNYLLTSRMEPNEMAPGDRADLRLEVAFVGAADLEPPFDVTNVVIAVDLPTGLEYLDHRGDGPFDPVAGLWTVPVLPPLGSAEMIITVTATEETIFRPHAEIASADWPDDDVTFGDGRGDDHTSLSLTVAAAPVTPVTDEATIGGLAWTDLDSNGVQDTDESGLADIAVVATDEAGTIYVSTTTADGRFRIVSLPAGVYRVSLDTATLPDDLEPPAEIFVVALGSGTDFLDADFGCTEAVRNFPWLPVSAAAAVVAIVAALVALVMVRRRENKGSDTPPRTGPPAPTTILTEFAKGP